MSAEDTAPQTAAEPLTQPPPSGTYDYIFYGTDSDSPEAIAALRAALGVTVIDRTQTWGFELWRTDKVLDADTLTALAAQGLSAESLSSISANLTITATEAAAQFNADPDSYRLWGQNNTGQTGGKVDADIDIPEAWEMSRGAGIIVAVIDTGVDYTHPDLAANMWINAAEIPGNGLDDDGNGYVDDIYGYDFAYNDSDPMDVNGHGTHVAGTIAATNGNGQGVTGVAPDAQLMALKFIDDGGSGSLFDAIQALEYAVMMGAQVSNNSWGGGGFSSALNAALARANAAGHVFVAAAGNDSANLSTAPHYPASYTAENLISVGASTDRDELAYFSNYSFTDVDVIAPGQSIYSTLVGGGYGLKSGTSMAAPHVAGAVALLLAQEPWLTPADVRARLIETSDPVAALAARSASSGRINAAEALAAGTGTGTGTTLIGQIVNDQGTGVAGWIVYLDQNGNGRRDAGELNGLTDASGRYSLAAATPGTYQVTVDLAPGYDLADGNTGYRLRAPLAWQDLGGTDALWAMRRAGAASVTLPFPFDGASRLSLAADGTLSLVGTTTTPLLRFGEALTTLHGGRVWVGTEPDAVTLHFDGVRDRTGSHVFDFQLTLTAQGDISLATRGALPTSTQLWLPDGTVIDPSLSADAGGLSLSPAPATQATAEITAEGTTTLPVITVTAETGAGTLTGQTWLDIDGDGLWDWGEAALAGRTVYLDLDHDGIRDLAEPWTTTDSAGAYRFAGLAPGAYQVRQDLAAGWTATATGTDSYQATATALPWTTLTGQSTALAGLGDDGALTLDLPFLFPFFGVGYGQVTVSANGYLTFGGDGTRHANQSLTDPGLPGPIIAAFWDDLTADGATLTYQTDPATERVAISFETVSPYSGSGSYTFQIVLYGTGRIDLIYGPLTGAVTSATVGISDGTTATALELIHDTAGLVDDIAFRFDPLAAPDTAAEATVAAGYTTTAPSLGSQPAAGVTTQPEALVSSIFDTLIDAAAPWLA